MKDGIFDSMALCMLQHIYLNPCFQYSLDFKLDLEIKLGLYTCPQRMIPAVCVRKKILKFFFFEN